MSRSRLCRGFTVAGGGEGPWTAPGRQREPVVGDVAPVLEADDLRGAVNPFTARAEAKFDFLILVEGTGLQEQSVPVKFARHVGLGERWALIRKVRLAADKRK